MSGEEVEEGLGTRLNWMQKSRTGMLIEKLIYASV